MRRVARQLALLGLGGLRRLIPLAARRSMVVWLARHGSVPYRDRLVFELVRDYAQRDPSGCHRFLWAHHLAYAASYSVEQRFGAEHINETRHLLFADLRRVLIERGIEPETDVRSVFEVGASLGYLLRHLETGLFRSATLEGIDIDRQAIEQGSAHLSAMGSKVQLRVADTLQLETVLGSRKADVFLCAGVLLYLADADARELVRSILGHTSMLAAFAGLAHPVQDNASLASSAVRERDATRIHNIDAMVREAGGDVVWRRWEGPRVVDGNTIYFVFASPEGRSRPSASRAP
jgi:hypothetical protein